MMLLVKIYHYIPNREGWVEEGLKEWIHGGVGRGKNG